MYGRFPNMDGYVLYLFILSTHRAPFRHGRSLHSSMFVSQRSPWKPARQVHEKPLMWSWQLPSWRQGCDWHSSIWSSQLLPGTAETAVLSAKMPIRFLSRSLHGLLHMPSGQASSWIKQTVTGSFQSVFRVIDMLPTAFPSLDENCFSSRSELWIFTSCKF